MTAGRPLKYDSLSTLKQMITRYFLACEGNPYTDENSGEIRLKTKPRPPTITGLARALGTNRQTLCNIEQLGHYADEFIDTIKDAKARVAEYVEEGLLTGTIKPAAGIFVLKVNHGYQEETVHKHEHTHKAISSDALAQRRKHVMEQRQQHLPEPDTVEIEVEHERS